MKLLNITKKVVKMEEEEDYKGSHKSSQYGSVKIEDKKQKYTSTQWLTLITLAFGNFCAGACVSLQAPFFPAEAENKGATPAEYGLIFGIFQLTIFLTAPIMGKVIACTSPKFVLNSGILTVGITCILFGTLDLVQKTTDFVALGFVIRTVEGIGAAALRTSCYTIIASQFTEGIGKTFASLEMFLGLGLITGPTLGGVLYDLGGYELPFYVIGSIVIIDAIAIVFILPEIERKELPEKGNMLKFWLNPYTLSFALSVFTSFHVIGFNQAALEPHIREFDLSGFVLGVIFALAGIVYALCAPFWGWLNDKVGNSHLLTLIGCMFTITSILIVGPAPFINVETQVYLVALSQICFGFGIGAKLVCAFTGTIKFALNQGMKPGLATYALVSSMIASSQSLGAFVGPSLGGFLSGKYGYRKATLVHLGLEIILIVIFLNITIFSKLKKKKKIPTLNGAVIAVIHSHDFSTKQETEALIEEE